MHNPKFCRPLSLLDQRDRRDMRQQSRVSVRHDRGAENQPKLQSILSILAAMISGGNAPAFVGGYSFEANS
jgi:hypothetical protein